MKQNHEYILCAAVMLERKYRKTEEPFTFKNPKVQEGWGKNDDIYDIAIGRRHCDIYWRYGEMVEKNPNSQGFYTSYGRFVDRKEAYMIAYNAGQVGGVFEANKLLYSEDLY